MNPKRNQWGDEGRIFSRHSRDIGCFRGNRFCGKMIVIGFNQFMFCFTAAILLLHAATVALVIVLNAISGAGDLAHAVMYIYRHTAGEGNVYNSKQ